MSDTQIQQPPKAHARIVFLGAVSPHWEVYGEWGDQNAIDEFRSRVLARLVLLPRDDPQFRRNMARIVRDAERELISLEWDMGDPNYSSKSLPVTLMRLAGEQMGNSRLQSVGGAFVGHYPDFV